MTDDSRLLLFALGAVVTLIVLIARFKLHPFVALIPVSLALGVAAGMPLGAPSRHSRTAWAQCSASSRSYSDSERCSER